MRTFSGVAKSNGLWVVTLEFDIMQRTQVEGSLRAIHEFTFYDNKSLTFGMKQINYLKLIFKQNFEIAHFYAKTNLKTFKDKQNVSRN